MTNEEIRTAFLPLARAMTTQVNRGMRPRVNANESTMTSRLRDFVRMNPPIFLGSRVGEDPQEFFDEVYKIVNAMGVSSREKAELASYQFKDVAQVWFTQWKANRLVEAGLIEHEGFKGAFLSKYFPHEKREVNQDRGTGPPFAKPTCHNYGKKHHGKCLAGTSECYGCGKNDHQVKDCRTLMARGREAKQASLNGPNLNAPKKNRFYVPQANKDRGANPDEGIGKL
ncbi:uncharacterized protein LOC125873796 [Solanum stenotomum]|uniref:uncharacterized protein LOC125873796 n=1 Tax=Solanum stenotomum TaxID=172797 RepID=UPI0020D1BE5B|nr:uncharacterized protein LOC125873796 [Solanum stenotomum]